MGKMKRSRQKLHTSAISSKGEKAKETSNDQEMESMDVTMDDMDKKSVKTIRSVAASKASTNLFKGVKITTELLKQNLPDFDAASVSRSLKGINLKKKDKKKIRHDIFMEKIDAVKQERKNKKDKKKREKTAVVGDLSGMVDALPTLELLMKQTSTAVLDREKKVKGIASEKRRQKNMVNDIKVFQQVLEVPEFKANPTKTILEHLRNKLKQEEQMDA